MHTIQSASERSGLTADVIRIWERRYQAVSPQRTSANQRLYSDADVERLALLKRITDGGRRISAVAQLDIAELRTLAEQTPTTPPVYRQPDPDQLGTNAINAILQLDPIAFDRILNQAMVSMGAVSFMLEFAAPLMETVGDLWRSGAVRTCQEHFASAHLRSFLGRYLLDANTNPDGPRIVMATLPGQAHELGATMASLIAAQGGWNVIYLGPNVPVEEIAFCADCKAARAVGISLGYPQDDPRVAPQLRDLKQKLPLDCRLLVGGAVADRYLALLKELDAWAAADLQQLALHLNTLR